MRIITIHPSSQISREIQLRPAGEDATTKTVPMVNDMPTKNLVYIMTGFRPCDTSEQGAAQIR